MKLLTKLTLFITLSKLAIVVLFISILPVLVERISSGYTNYYLGQQKNEVLKVIDRNGIDYYLQGDSSYGSYTMLKEEYVSLEPVTSTTIRDTIETAARVIEKDTLNYRILTHQFDVQGRPYVVEIGKKVELISQYSRPLQRIALYVLAALILLTIIIDLLFTRVLLRPLKLIIESKLVNRKFPFNQPVLPVATSTKDFRDLDDTLIALMRRIHEDFEKEREFTSNASHELLTPIGILQTKMENLLMEERLDEQSSEKLIGMMKTLNRLKKIVQSLLLISRIENDQYAKSDKLTVNSLFVEIWDELGHRVEENQLQVNMSLTEHVLIHEVNHDLLFQLFYNLLNNAIRYNRAGGAIEIFDGYDHTGKYMVHISDTGVGINAEDLQFIFDRFRKVGSNGSEGFGLGLSIVKSIATFHGITVSANSEPGVGTTVSVGFPGNLQARQ